MIFVFFVEQMGPRAPPSPSPAQATATTSSYCGTRQPAAGRRAGWLISFVTSVSIPTDRKV